MHIGLHIPSFKYPGGTAAIRPRLKDIVTTAENSGFYSLWVMDHFYQIKGQFGEDYTDPMMEAYTTLGYVAGLTEKAYLGVLVTGLIYRHPSVLLKAVNTLDILAGGRTYFGIGAAWYEEEAKGYGIPFPSTSERFEQLEDTLQLAKALWASDETSFAGRHLSAPAITNNPRPLSNPHPRIMIGGTGPNKTLRMVAQYGDACNIWVGVGPENMQKALDTLKGHCEALGRDYDTIEKTSLCTVHLSGNDTVDSVTRHIKQLSEMGFTHAIFNMPDVYEMTPLKIFAQEIIRIAATCVCGSDLWPYRGVAPITQPQPMGHEYCGIVEEVGSAVRHIKPGQFVVGSFATSDNTCPNCQFGYPSSCVQREFMSRAQAPVLRVPLADGTLVATPGLPAEDLIPSLLATSDVLGTGWFAADAANVKPDSTVVVVGDGAVGLLGVLSAKQMGAGRIIAMSRHATRQQLAQEFGATDIVTERGDEGIARIMAMTNGIGADSVLECVGTQEAMMQAIRSTRKGGYVSYVGVPHEVELNGKELFRTHVHLHGGPAPVRRYLPTLIDLVWNRTMNPGKVFDLTLPLDEVAEGYRAMDERRAIKTLLRP